MATKTILVEDSEIIRANLIPAMKDLANVEVVSVAETQEQALDALQAHVNHWELAIVDLFLKEGSGLGVLRGCMNRLPTQVVLVLTNYPTKEMRDRCAKYGADGVFDKSTELEAFFERCLLIGSSGT
jgi:DNA-binding NarL/FixJ family response regulator